MDNLLYYPYINIPPTNWTARALLYYDHIGTIVPQSYFYEPGQYEPFMRELVTNELVIPINPIETLNNPWEVSRPFLEYVKSKEFKLELRRKRFVPRKSGLINREKFEPKKSDIHADKFDGEIFYQLEQAGLASRIDGDWYSVESRTANELMSFLALVVGGKLDYLPTTDKYRKSFSIASRNKKEFKTKHKQQLKRELILDELIPYPEYIDLSKLRSFKDKYPNLLGAFKNKVELIALDPSIEEGSDRFKEIIRELQLRKEELSTKMSESKLGQVFFGTVCGITGALYGLTTAQTPGAVLGGMPGFASAVYSALKIEGAEQVFDQSGMKYLALIDKRIRNKLITVAKNP